MIAERVYKGLHFKAKARLEHISLQLIMKYIAYNEVHELGASINTLCCIC